MWSVTRALLLFACVFNIAFPKAGIHFGDVPVTAGYILVALCSMMALFTSVDAYRIYLGSVLVTVVVAFSFAAIMIGKVGAGVEFNSLAAVAALNFIVFPVIFFTLWPQMLARLCDDDIMAPLVWCIRFAVVYGIVGFFWFIVFHSELSIPFLSTNADDLGTVFDRNNMRGPLMKLVSTYNNGNIFGLSMLILMPSYISFERYRVMQMLFLLALLFTLSRTVWFGALVSLLIMTQLDLVRARGLAPVACLIAGACLVLVIPMIGWSIDDVFDTTLNNRSDQMDAAWSLFGADEIRIPEMTYFGVLNSFGFAGLALFILLVLWVPTLVLVDTRSAPLIVRSSVAGALSYLFAALVDGAIQFPPVFALYMFSMAVILRSQYLPKRAQLEP